MNLYESIKKYGLNESVNYKGLYASSTPDEEPNKGGYFCQVYADQSMDNDVDDFVIHKEDLEHGEDYEDLMLNYLQDNYYTIFRGVLKHFLKGVYGEYGKDYIFIDHVNDNTDLDSILDSVIASYADENTSDHIGFYLQDLLNDPHGLLEIKTDLTESVITADDLIVDAKRDLNVEPGSDEEYMLDNLYVPLRDLDKWIESLYDEGLTSDEIKRKFAIDGVDVSYGLSPEELDAKVDSFNETDGIEVHTMDNDPSWAAAVNKVNKEYSKNKSKISDDIAKEYARFTKKLTSSGLFKPEDVWELPEGKAYRDAIKDPEDIWCDCNSDSGSKFKPDGASYLGVSKHGYICNKCKKFTQIG